MQSKDTLFIMEKFIFIAFLDVMLASLLMFQPIICSSNFTDQVALLHFKSAIEIDPTNMIKGGNWTAEANFCEWIGVVCSNRRQRVTALNLSYMGLQGRLSPYLGSLSFLASLRLRNNSFNGKIPIEIGHLRCLKVLNTPIEPLEGNIPPNLAQCQNLEGISLMANKLTGGIPREFGAFPKLQALYLSHNELWGQIPSNLGNISTLQIISLIMAGLTGSIPSTFFNRSFTHVILTENHLSGSLPFDLCYRWHNIEILELSVNQFNGLLPETLTQCKELLVLGLSLNHFRGSIPRDIDRLQKLQQLFLGGNNLTGTIPRTIGNMSSLRRLDVTVNYIGGGIPSEIGNLINLEHLGFGSNLLTDKVPRENRFGGNIPQHISNFTNLITFNAWHNQLSGPIPMSLGDLKSLGIFRAQANQLTGEPYDSELGFLSALSNCQSLRTLALGRNPLLGSIPKSIKNFSNSLQTLTAQECKIRGRIPEEMGFLKRLTLLALSGNDLVSNILSPIRGLESLQRLYLDDNHLEGPIPNQICNLTSLGDLVLQQNRISGSIPNCIGNLSSLQIFFVNSNNMTSAIPISLWSLQELRKHGKIGKNDPVLVENPPRTDYPMISYRELCLATNNFSRSNLLGVGSFSSVYKGTLANRTDVAVKVLNLLIEGALRSFDTECEVFRNIRHQNLVKRVKIMVDVATAIEYLHHGQPEPIVHCDLKPSNVLLNEDLVAQVCDFGIAKILAENKLEAQTRTLGMIGYIALEYGLKGKVSTKGDIYSFGILLLEVITRKKPTDEMFNADMSLRQ
ncbi:LOW QUALITY PROTEIN: hypothetical protein BT93_C1489 [Corymbia citriodora subsp. variegata]|nr:LOW QUALITY PROTEIN: hypothetical protein BT93_C1489 [Corymbia citriodora subsp. variegata]